MAIYHLGVTRISRRRAQSAVASASYYSDEALSDRRTGITHRMPVRPGLLHSEIVFPRRTTFPVNREALWNLAEEAEKRSDSTVAFLWDVALPNELTDQQNCALAQAFTQFLSDFFWCAADLAVRRIECVNIVATIMTTTREISGEALGRKISLGIAGDERRDRGLSPSPMADLKAIREYWAKLCNDHLDAAGRAERIDHRSLADQAGSALMEARRALDHGEEERAQNALSLAEKKIVAPGRHLGPVVMRMERQALETARMSGLPYKPVTDRMREALECGYAPALFAESYGAQTTEK